MAEFNVNIPDELMNEMKKSNIDVTKFVNKKIREEITLFLLLRKITDKSNLKSEDIVQLGNKIKKGRFEKLKKEGLIRNDISR